MSSKEWRWYLTKGPLSQQRNYGGLNLVEMAIQTSNPWALLWNAKYTGNYPREELIRMSETSSGSIMWNSTKQHKTLIQQHGFWEVKSGNNARFWEDSWQQMPKLRDLLPPNPLLEQGMQPQHMVGNFWRNSTH